MKNLAAVVLAAGKGTRMKSDLPKVLHPILGRPMINHLLDNLIALKIEKIVVVVGYKAELVQTELASYGGKIEFVVQAEQLGTGHAVMMAEEMLSEFDGDILVLAGDVPFLSRETIAKLVEVHHREKAAATVLSAVPPDATGYGRVIREPGTDIVDCIVEHKDATDEQKKVGEINSGIFCFDNRYLFDSLREIKSDNSQKEYYLTDIMAILNRRGMKAAVYKTDNADEVLGINSLEQMADLEARFGSE